MIKRAIAIFIVGNPHSRVPDALYLKDRRK